MELHPLRPGADRLVVQLERLRDAVEQQLPAEGLLDEVDGAGLHRPHRRAYVAVSGDHDDRQLDLEPGERALEIEATHPRQADVGDEAARTPPVLALEKLLRVGIRFHRDGDRGEHVADGLSHLRVILDYVNCLVCHHGPHLTEAWAGRAHRAAGTLAPARPGLSRRMLTRIPRCSSAANRS